MRARLLVFPVVVLALQLVRCGESTGGGGDQLPDVIYEGDASDEALAVLYPRLGDATAKDSLALVSPDAGEQLHVTPAPTFAWAAQASVTPRFPGSAWPLPLGPAVAAAHLPPVTGNVVLLEIIGAATVRVFTTGDAWIPAPADWATITGGTAGTITVKLYGAYLNENVIEEGPFRSPSAVTFEVADP